MQQWADRIASAAQNDEPVTNRPTYNQLAAVNQEQQETIDRLERENVRLSQLLAVATQGRRQGW